MERIITKKLWSDSLRIQRELIGNAFELSTRDDILDVVRHNLNREDVSLSLRLIFYFPENLKIAILPELLIIMSNLDGNTKICQDIILTINKEWLKKNIWSLSEVFFSNDDYQTIGIFLNLFKEIDINLAYSLAEISIKNSNDDIADVGNIFLEENNRGKFL